MAAKILDGIRIKAGIKRDLKRKLNKIKKSRPLNLPKLAIVRVGRDASSSVYANSVIKTAEDLGIGCRIQRIPASVSFNKLTRAINKLNKDNSVSGIMVQMPLPKRLNASKVISLISPDKDVEGLHPENMGRLFSGEYKVAPCTALAVMEMLKFSKVNLYGKEIVIVGHSQIVGKPLSIMLLNEFATTAVCHIATSKRKLLKQHVEKAEVLISATGVAGLIKGEWIKRGAVVIDIGISKYKGRITGDIEFEKAKKRACLITPVPGGVGPVTVCMLMKNLLQLFIERER